MRKRSKRRRFGLFMTVVMVFALFTGCGSASQEEKKVDSGGSDGEKKVIKLAHMFTEGEGTTTFMSDPYQWVLASVEKFEKENPEYKVELEYIPGNDYSTKILTDHASGIQHDVVMLQSTYNAQAIEENALTDITTGFSEWSKEEQDDFTWNPTWDSYEEEGKLYGLPLGLHTRTIAYRKDMFKDAGLDPNTPPKDWDELIEYAEKLTKDDVWGLGIYMGPHIASSEVFIMPAAWSRGGAIFDEETQMATFNSPEVADTIQWMYDCIYKYKVTPTWTLEGAQDESLLKPFLNGQFAMAFGIGNYWLSDLQNAGLLSGAYPASADVDDSKIGWFVVPDETGKTFANSWGAGISSDTTDKEGAFKLLTCMADKEILKKFVAYGGFPGRISEFDEPEYQGEFWQNWLDISRTGVSLKSKNYNAIIENMSAAMQEIITSEDDSSIEEVLQKYQDEFNNRYGGK